MIPKQCKRLAEVDFPIAEVSKHSAREKSIRHGHPSTLHLWWARRPLAACRAMLMALLLPDPCDANCPGDFKREARKILPGFKSEIGAKDADLRKCLLKFIADFSNWDNASNPTFLEIGRGLVKAAHGEEIPLVADPFAGGGSIPLEALRLGCDAFASDLNPVACLILKVMLEDIPRHGPKLAEELRKAGKEIQQAAEKELAEFYPQDSDKSKPIAYLWARTVRCETPNCGAEIPLVRSFWLCKKAGRYRALKPEIIKPKGKTPHVEFEIFEPRNENEVGSGTVTRAKATCLCCHIVLPPDRVRSQLSEQRGGADVIFDEKGNRIGGARLLAVVTLKPGRQGRWYRLPVDEDYKAVWKAKKALENIVARASSLQKKENTEEDQISNNAGRMPALHLNPVPDEPTPAGGGSGAGRAFSVQKYGMLQWGDLFTARQKVALTTISGLTQNQSDGSRIKEPLSLALTRSANALTCLSRWDITRENNQGVYSRQALPIVWDFCEASPLSSSTGGYLGALDWVAGVVEAWPKSGIGQVQLSDSTQSPLPAETIDAWFTDPPYYDAIPYSDLSDFFFVWLKRVLPNHPLLHDPYDSTNQLTPKLHEAVQDETKKVNGRPKDRLFFEETMGRAFSEGRRALKEDGVGCVVFAHKTTEGWEALLSGMIQGGWIITGSWPIATEMGSRLRAMDSAALATSVHLVCRPRTEDEIGDWGEVLGELPKRVGDWMERLQEEGIRGADLVFACIGPALEIFSRYSRVETAEGKEITLAEYLLKVWEVVGRSALEQILGTDEAKARNGMAGVIEEDARLTALFLWTLQSTKTEAGNGSPSPSEEDDPEEDEDEDAPRKKTKGFSLVYDVARRFAQPLGIHLQDWEDRIIETSKGVVRLMAVSERARQLFGESGAQAVAHDLETNPFQTIQLKLFPDEVEMAMRLKKKSSAGFQPAIDEKSRQDACATTLDRVHAAMLLQKSGKTNALRNLLKSEKEKGTNFLRLADALSALYPKGSEEKRLVDCFQAIRI